MQSWGIVMFPLCISTCSSQWGNSGTVASASDKFQSTANGAAPTLGTFPLSTLAKNLKCMPIHFLIKKHNRCYRSGKKMCTNIIVS